MSFFGMSIGTCSLLEGFFAGSSAASWMTKDLAPTLLSALSVAWLSPERDVRRGFVAACIMTNAAVCLDFIIPFFSAPVWFPYLAAISSLLKCSAMLMFGVCRASILEDFALGDNLGTLVKTFTSTTLVLHTCFYALGIAFVAISSTMLQVCALTCSVAVSVVASVAAIRDVTVKRISTDLAVHVVRCAIRSDRRIPSPHEWQSGAVSEKASDVSTLSVGPDLHSIAIDLADFQRRMQHFPEEGLRCSIGRCRSGRIALLFHEPATLADMLAGIELGVRTDDLCRSNAASVHENILTVHGLHASWKGRGAVLEALLRDAGWKTSSHDIDDVSKRIRFVH